MGQFKGESLFYVDHGGSGDQKRNKHYTKSIELGNYAKFLKNLHSEQIAKLQAKNQHECDLLEDIRQYTLKKSAIEKSYSEALLKISSAYLNKKIPNIPDIKIDGSDEKWNMWSVWRTVLEENEKLARARLAAVEVFQQQIADEAKALRARKVSSCRKTLDQLANVQKELQVCVQDVDKTKKLYFDEEHSAHDVRDKAKDIEEKLKKKKGSFFQSITSLQKNSARVSSRRDQLEEKSSGARNDYLLSLAAANAHQTRYFVVDLQTAMTGMEDYVYERVAEYLTLMGRTELLTCSATQNSYGKIRDQAQQLTREYNIQCCHLYYPVLKQHIQYEFEPCDNDPIDKVTIDHESAAQTLSHEAKRWATRIARETNAIKENTRRMQVCIALRESGQRADPADPNGPDLECKAEELRQAVRRSETAKAKAEARLECLRAGGISVDEWVREAAAETLDVQQDVQRSSSSLSLRTDASGHDQPSSDSFYDSDTDHAEVAVSREPEQVRPQSPESMHDDITSMQDAEVDAMLEQERQRIEQLTAGWDDPTQVDWSEMDAAAGVESAAPQEPAGPTYKCTALYSYTAQNPDELSIVENEQLEVVGEGDGDGWLRARNYRGEEGFVPHNYLDVERDQPSNDSMMLPQNGADRDGSAGGLQQQISFSSVDYTIAEQDHDACQESSQTQSPDQVSVISAPGAHKPQPQTEFCCAMYDYDAAAEDELTFEEGQIIKILTKSAHGVDDGWWEGELEGQRGYFPSLVVELCDENGELLSEEEDESPVDPTGPAICPPACTPPQGPADANKLLFGSPPADITVTQPTPCAEKQSEEFQEGASRTAASGQASAAEKSATSPAAGEQPQAFSMVLAKWQQTQYGTQFDGDQQKYGKVDIPCLLIEDEDRNDITGDHADDESNFSRNFAQIVITAATPMVEDPDKKFPPAEETKSVEKEPLPEEEEEDVPEPDQTSEIAKEPEPAAAAEVKQEEEETSVADDQPADCGPFPVSSSSASEGESTGPSTAENSQQHEPSGNQPDQDHDQDAPKQVVGGRASIPEELAPHQLARLQNLKESNA